MSQDPQDLLTNVQSLIAELRRLKRSLERDSYRDDVIYEVPLRNLAAAIAKKWSREIRPKLSSSADFALFEQIHPRFQELARLSKGTFVRYRYDSEIRVVLEVLPKLEEIFLFQSFPNSALPGKRSGARRVFVSMPADNSLTPIQNKIKWGIVKKIEDLGYEAQVFTGPAGGLGLAAGKPWNFENVDEVMRRCCAAALIGMPKWKFKLKGRNVSLATEYSNYEGAVAYTLGLPILAVVQSDIERRAVFSNQGLEMALVPENANERWLDHPSFTGPFSNWANLITKRQDIFLGYCGSSHKLAEKIRQFLANELNLTVLDWRKDFAPARSILAEIQTASSLCSAGIFLFTKDDALNEKTESALPRDNVVFESGFFAAAKGKSRVLIVLEKGTKMPADLGGDIYAPMEDRTNLTSVYADIKRFVTSRL
jgi:hypothetical protein